MHRTVFALVVVVGLASVSSLAAQEATPTAPPPKCAAIAAKKFPDAPPKAAAKQGRFASCMPAKECNASDAKAIAALGKAFCQMNYTQECRVGTCEKPTLSCQPELRPKETSGIKLANCVSRASAIACPKAGDEICLCDLELEAKGSLTCGCSCQIAPTPTPTAR